MKTSLALALALASSLVLGVGPALAGSGHGVNRGAFTTRHDPWRQWGRQLHHGHGHVTGHHQRHFGGHHHGHGLHHGRGFIRHHNETVIVVPRSHGRIVSPAPARRVFVPGYWAWFGRGWVWVPGHWTW